MKRRQFVNIFLGGSLLATLSALLYPVIRFLIPPKQMESSARKVSAAKVGELAPNSSKLFRFGSSAGILIHTKEGELRAFSATCTHLTCTVHYESDTETLLCPCHNGRFDLSGNVLSGPPPAPLEAYLVEVAGDEIMVSRES